MTGTCSNCGIDSDLREGICASCREGNAPVGKLFRDAVGEKEDPDRTEVMPQAGDRSSLRNKETVLRKLGTEEKYERKERLGAGGMGEVFKAWDREVKRWVALKFLKREDQADIARFKREARTVGKLNHPNIAALYEIGEMEGHHFIAMQFIEGVTLDEIPRDDPRVIADLVRDAAAAVHFAHEKGVIHRDLKPANLMAEKIGASTPRPSSSSTGRFAKGWHIYVMDFGLAKEVQVDSSLSATGLVMGTPAFMSPEQARGDSGTMGPASDVYSMGITLYQLLTGRLPFDGASPFDVLKKAVEVEPVGPRKINRAIPPDLETIVLKCVEKDPGRRYPSALELAEDLSRWLAGEPIEAHPPSFFYRARKLVRRKKAAFSVAVVGLVALLVVSGILGSRWLGERSEKERVRTERAREIENDFQYARKSAEMAFLEKEWSAAIFQGRQALKIRDDVRMRKLVEGSEARVAAEGKAAPLARLIEDTRPLFYAKDRDIRARLDEVEEAVEILAEIMHAPVAADYPQGWASLGAGYYMVGHFMEAEAALLKADVLSPGNGRVNYYLGRTYLERILIHMEHRSVLDLEEEKEMTSRIIDTLARKYLDYIGKNGKNLEEMEQLVILGYGAFLRDKKKKRRQTEGYVLEICKDGLRKYAGEFGLEDFWHLKALYEDSPGKKISMYRKALAHRPHFAFGHFGIAVQLQRQGDLDGAIEEYSRTLELRPLFYPALMKCGDARWNKGDHTGAILDYTRVQEIYPGYVKAWTRRGRLLREMGDFDAAIEDCTHAIGLDPAWAFPFAVRGTANFQKGEMEHAMDDYSRSIELEPGVSRIWYNRGAVRRHNKDWAGAVADYTRALELDPKSHKAFYKRGDSRRMIGDIRGAVSDYRKSLELAPAEWKFRKQVESSLRSLSRER